MELKFYLKFVSHLFQMGNWEVEDDDTMAIKDEPLPGEEVKPIFKIKIIAFQFLRSLT